MQRYEFTPKERLRDCFTATNSVKKIRPGGLIPERRRKASGSGEPAPLPGRGSQGTNPRGSPTGVDRRMSAKAGLSDRLIQSAGAVLPRPFQAFPVVDLLGFMDGLTEGYRASVLGDLLKPSRPAIGEHEVCFSDT